MFLAKANKDIYIYEILSLLDDKGEPLGCGFLSQHLISLGFELSEATVGRMLSKLDNEGCTEKVGFQGRRITGTGRAKLAQLRNQQNRLIYGNRFIESLQASKQEDLLEILTARRAIERELARLAAMNATDEEIGQLESVIREQQQNPVKKQLSLEHDVKFHKLLASTAKNKVLAAALDLIRHDAQLSPILTYIRTKVGGKLVVDHSQIVQAVKERDPDKAEQAMINHVEGLINDVQKYWNTVHRTGQEC